MAQRATIDATNIPELRRIAEEVRGSQEPIVLQADGEDIAAVVPLGRQERHTHFEPTEDKKQIRKGRGSGQPPIEPHLPDESSDSQSWEADKPSPEDIDKLLSTFGSLKGLIDPDKVKAEIREGRGSNRPFRPI